MESLTAENEHLRMKLQYNRTQNFELRAQLARMQNEGEEKDKFISDLGESFGRYCVPLSDSCSLLTTSRVSRSAQHQGSSRRFGISQPCASTGPQEVAGKEGVIFTVVGVMFADVAMEGTALSTL